MGPGSSSRSRSRSSSRTRSSEQGSNTAASSKPPNRRGTALNKQLDTLIKEGMLRPKIEFKAGLARPVCNWGKQFVREVGIVCRANASLACHRWKEIKETHGDVFYKKILKKFDVNFDDPLVREIVDKQMGESLRQHRCRLHGYYKSLGDGVDKKAKPPKNVAQPAWAEICTWFETEEFKKLSDKNTANKQQSKINHRGGSKSFAVYFEEDKEREREAAAAREAAGDVDITQDANHQEVGRIEFYRQMHYNEKKGWISDLAKQNYNDMLKLKEQPPAEGSKPMTEDDICDKVLGTKRNYTRGLGNGFVTTQRAVAYNSNNADFEEYKRRAEETERHNVELSTQVQSLTDRQARMEMLLSQLVPGFVVDGQ